MNPEQQVLEAMRQREQDYLNRDAPGHTPATEEQIEALKAYWKSVFERPEKQSLPPVTRNTNPEMDYETARKKVWALLQLRAAHIMQIEGRDFNWQFDEDEKVIVRNLTKYFINDQSCDWPLTKGLFLYGAPGTGKTELMQVMERFCRENELGKAFHFSSMSGIYMKAKTEKECDPVTPNIQYDRCFDEIGRNVGAVIRFGDSLDINEATIEARYERNRRYGQLTHFIANATPNEIQDAFSSMIFDRFRSMCTGVVFKGKSKR